MKQSTSTANHQLTETRDNFYGSLITRQVAAAAACLHKNFLFTHADALVQYRDKFIVEFLLNKDLLMKSIATADEELVITGDTAMITAAVEVNIIARGVPITHHERFTEIYVKQSDSWKLLTIHGTFIPAA